MIIAVATNDRKTLAKRTGRAKEFAFYTIEAGKITDIRYERNEHDHHHHHHDDDEHVPNHRKMQAYGRGFGSGHRRHQHEEHTHEHGEHSHDEVVEQMKDVTIFLVRAVGKHMRGDLEKGKIPFKVVKNEDIEEAIHDYLKSISQ